MARATLALAVLAILCASAMADYVEVLIKWDNTLAQTQKNQKAIMEELAKELCKVPLSQVMTLKTVDKSVPVVNTESWGYYACLAKSTAEAGKIVTNCNTKKLQKEFKDELEDRTMPDHEAEGFSCTLRAGSPIGRRHMA